MLLLRLRGQLSDVVKDRACKVIRLREIWPVVSYIAIPLLSMWTLPTLVQNIYVGFFVNHVCKWHVRILPDLLNHVFILLLEPVWGIHRFVGGLILCLNPFSFGFSGLTPVFLVVLAYFRFQIGDFDLRVLVNQHPGKVHIISLIGEGWVLRIFHKLIKPFFNFLLVDLRSICNSGPLGDILLNTFTHSVESFTV